MYQNLQLATGIILFMKRRTCTTRVYFLKPVLFECELQKLYFVQQISTQQEPCLHEEPI